jgi:preprotein translocase subunit SecF
VSTNQLRRQDEENKNLREELEKAENREREHVTKLREENHRYTDLESKVCLMMPTQMLHNMLYSVLYIYLYIFVYFAQTFFFSVAYIIDNEFQVLRSSVQNG